MPWEYDLEFCEVLCKGCHAREHGKIKPLDGWILLHSDFDTGKPSHNTNCEHCGASMRWHNVLYHPEWGEITVGADCAIKLGDGDVYQAMKQQERLRTFTKSPLWRRVRGGLKYKFNGNEVLIYGEEPSLRMSINDKWGKMTYRLIEHAKHRAFLVLFASERVKALAKVQG